MQHEHISLPEHMSLYCLLSCQLPSCASAPRGESMCQHLHTFTQQVSEAASYVVFFLLLLVNICECVPKGADGQTVGCPTALQVAGASQNAEQTQQVLIPPPSTSQVRLPHHSFIHWDDRGPAYRPDAATVKRGISFGVVCNPAALE